MMNRPSRRLLVLVLAGVLVIFANQMLVADEPATAMALRSIFNPQRAPANKTMGLTQRSFIDLVDSSRPRLEIALVVDGTESMANSLQGIRAAMSEMIQDLELFKEAQPAFQLIVFRDVGSPSGEVSFPLTVAGKGFSTDREALERAVENIVADTGAPYFPELIDKGIYAALSELEWSTDEQTSRWLLVFGDAPPYDLGFEEVNTKASRRYDTSYLASLAEQKGIHINCILCTSRDEEQQAYESVLEKTRQFMSVLSSETDGLMLDLSYADIRTALQQAAQKQRVSYSSVGQITDEELRQLREAAEREKSSLAASRRVRLAVLPHLPIEQMSFDPRKREVIVATDLREKLRRIPGVEVKSPTAVGRQLPVLIRRGVQDDQLLQALATVLNVDYVVWGVVQNDQGVEKYLTSIYQGSTGAKIAEGTAISNLESAIGDATGQITRSLITNVMRARGDAKLTNAFASLNVIPGGGNMVLTPVSNTPAAENGLLAGYEYLEQATAYLAGDRQASPLLERAAASLSDAIASDRDNPLAHLLLANCYFAQAQILSDQNQTEQAAEKMQQFRAELNRANRNQSKLNRDDLKNEIKADFALFGRQGGAAEAIELYESLTKSSGQPDDKISLESALRAHWMLAGIYSGDWGVDAALRDPEEARSHLASILAHWPDSHQAEIIRRDLRWDPAVGKNRLESVPRRHEALFD
jgi:Tfp pilus assembly protein PilF